MSPEFMRTFTVTPIKYFNIWNYTDVFIKTNLFFCDHQSNVSGGGGCSWSLEKWTTWTECFMKLHLASTTRRWGSTRAGRGVKEWTTFQRRIQTAWTSARLHQMDGRWWYWSPPTSRSSRRDDGWTPEPFYRCRPSWFCLINSDLKHRLSESFFLWPKM